MFSWTTLTLAFSEPCLPISAACPVSGGIMSDEEEFLSEESYEFEFEDDDVDIDDEVEKTENSIVRKGQSCF